MLHCDLVNFNFTLTVVRRRVFFFPTQVSSPIFGVAFILTGKSSFLSLFTVT